jgi:hypothetical protein
MPQRLMYFELDKKGNLKTKITEPHHMTFNDITAQSQSQSQHIPLYPIESTIPPITVQTPITVQAPVTQSIIGDEEFFETAMEMTEFDFDWDMMEFS